jgi:hypothetical protein
MPYVTVGKENGANIDIYYKDWERAADCIQPRLALGG